MLTVIPLPCRQLFARRAAGRLLSAAGLLALAACANVPDVSNRIGPEAAETEWPRLLPQNDLLPATTVDTEAEAARQQELMARTEVLLAKPSLTAAERAELRRILAALDTRA